MSRPRSYRDVILGHNPYAYLRLGDGPTSFKDEVGGHYGQCTSSVSDVTSRHFGVLPNDPTQSTFFGGGNTSPTTEIGLTNTAAWDPTTLTCECWVYPIAAQTNQLWSKELTQNQNWRVRIDGGNTVTILVQGGSHVQSSSGTVTQNAWNHVVVSMSGSAGSGTCQIFINGKLDISGTTGIGPGSNYPLTIGNSPGEEMKGYMQECAFYLYKLTPGQVAEHYRSRVNPAPRRFFAVNSGGANVFTSSLSGSLSFSGTTTKQAQKSLAASASFSGNAPQRAIAKGMGGSLGFAGNLPRQAQKSLAAGLSFVGGGPVRAIVKSALTAVLSFSGALRRAIVKSALTAALGFAGSLITGNQYLRSLTATLSFSGAISKQPQKSLGGGLSFSGSIPSRAITKAVFVATLTFTGAANRLVTTKSQFQAGLSFAGNLITGRQYLRTLIANLTLSGAHNRLIITKSSFQAGLSFSGSIPSRVISKGLGSALSFTGTLPRLTSKASLAAALSFSGALANGRQYVRALTASLSFAGGVSKQTQRTVTAALGFTGTIPSRAIAKALGAGLSFVGGGPTRRIGKALSGLLGFLGNLVSSGGGITPQGPGSVQVFVRDAFPTMVAIMDITGGSQMFMVGKAIRIANWAGPNVASASGGYRNAQGTLYDPGTPTLKYQIAGVTTTVSGGSLTKDGVGLYSATVTPGTAGDGLAVYLSSDGAYSDVATFKVEPAPL